MNAWILIGLIGQGFFFSRFLFQWLASERAGRSVVPRGFWMMSLAGAACVLLYALHRRDPVFVLGTLPAALVYARNMFFEQKLGPGKLAPIAIALIAFVVWAALMKPYVDSMLWAVIGFCGSVIWMSRFVVQWWISEKRGCTTLPTAFWIMSLVGNILLLAYSIYRRDPVFIPGQSIGYLVYSRNLYLIYRERGEADIETAETVERIQ